MKLFGGAAEIKRLRQRKKNMQIPRCRVPDDCIDPKRYPLFMGRAVMQELINSLKAQAQSSTGKGRPS